MRLWLKELRQSHGLTMKDMGDRLDISESYYCAIENGDRQKKMDIMLAAGIAAVFHIPVSKVVSFEQNEQMVNN